MGISADPEVLSKYSHYSIRQFVKIKAKDYAFDKLINIKATHSKLIYLKYSELKLQSFFTLPGVKISEARSAFLFRVHMHKFAANYGAKGSRLCPLCEKHNDSQEELASCDKLKSYFKGSVQQVLQNIYSENISLETIKCIYETIRIRNQKLKDLSEQKTEKG